MWHARKTTIHCIGVRPSLSGTVVFDKCSKSGHFTKQCPSLQKWKKCRDHVIYTPQGFNNETLTVITNMRRPWVCDSAHVTIGPTMTSVTNDVHAKPLPRLFQSELHSISGYLVNVKTPRWVVMEEAPCICHHRHLLTSQWNLAVRSRGKTHNIEALVLWKITSNISSCSVAFDKAGLPKACQDWGGHAHGPLG